MLMSAPFFACYQGWAQKKKKKTWSDDIRRLLLKKIQYFHPPKKKPWIQVKTWGRPSLCNVLYKSHSWQLFPLLTVSLPVDKPVEQERHDDQEDQDGKHNTDNSTSTEPTTARGRWGKRADRPETKSGELCNCPSKSVVLVVKNICT